MVLINLQHINLSEIYNRLCVPSLTTKISRKVGAQHGIKAYMIKWGTIAIFVNPILLKYVEFKQKVEQACILSML